MEGWTTAMAGDAPGMTAGSTLIVLEGGVYLIPREALEAFRAPDEIAVKVREEVDARSAEVTGFLDPTVPLTAKWELSELDASKSEFIARFHPLGARVFRGEIVGLEPNA